MILAELEVFHSRPIAPTRRVALGARDLPVTPAPGFGGVLLGGIVAAHMPTLDPDMFDDLDRLTRQLEAGYRIPQPRLRHRLQTDRVGLQRSFHCLRGDGEELRFEIDDKGAPAHHILAAVYAAGDLPFGPRSRVMEAIRKAMRWSGSIDGELVAHLSGLTRHQTWSAEAYRDPVAWALGVLGLGDGARQPGRRAIQRRFRDLVRVAHPDHGGDRGEAAQRLAELSEARRILLAG
ncbi:MAG TPA: J domain-containing protein [Acidimicrobiales bacterium]|nr:J domain-containing protein [Acidimicrobiales bacterium]